MSTITEANARSQNTLMSHLGIEYTEITTDYIEATMPVTQNHTQPMGLLHGGASLALAESVGSLGSAMQVDLQKYAVVGLSMTANHIKSAVVGQTVTAKANIVHRGRSTHIWDIDIVNEDEKLISSCRLTNYIKPMKTD